MLAPLPPPLPSPTHLLVVPQLPAAAELGQRKVLLAQLAHAALAAAAVRLAGRRRVEALEALDRGLCVRVCMHMDRAGSGWM